MDQTFCEKIPLDGQFADLLIQLGQPGIVGRSPIGCIGVAAGEQRADTVENRLLPGMDLAGVDPIPAR
jgi:hypothetical protein